MENWIIAALSSAVAGVTWSLRLESRVNGHDRLFEERQKQADLIVESIETNTAIITTDIKDRLVRIERKLDNMNGRGDH